MIAHEKAIQLIAEFKAILIDEDTDCFNDRQFTLIAKKCALLAVQNIIDNNPTSLVGNSKKYYWQTVAKEIEDF